jgi:NAD(P)-dependent dehydrogenase (short-subunit alcohol dehydrogenase family)
MSQQHQGQRILITAAATGIGRAIAEAFLAQGAQVHICDISAEHSAACKATLPGTGVTLADVSAPDQVDLLFQDVLSGMGGLDVLVNNVGVSGPTAPVEEVRIEEWIDTLSANISSHFYCTRKAVPLLKASGGGAIVNIGKAVKTPPF